MHRMGSMMYRNCALLFYRGQVKFHIFIVYHSKRHHVFFITSLIAHHPSHSHISFNKKRHSYLTLSTFVEVSQSNIRLRLISEIHEVSVLR